MSSSGQSIADLRVRVGTEKLAALRARAVCLGLEVDALIDEYVAYLLAGGEPVTSTDRELDVRELARAAEAGGSFDWLADEPDIYASDDGEPV